MTDLTLPAVFIAGFLSFLSPCVLPLVPPYLCFLAGTNINDLAQAHKQDRVLYRHAFVTALAFVFGFACVFIALGAGASILGATLRSYTNVLAQIAGLWIMLMGLNFIGVFRFAFLQREMRVNIEGSSLRFGRAFIMGLAFAFGWTPCIGPILAGVLAVAGSEASLTRGIGLLVVYSAGLGTPFLLAVLFMEPFNRFLQRFRTYLGVVEKIIGFLLVLTGLAFLTGTLTQIGIFLIEYFPALTKLG